MGVPHSTRTNNHVPHAFTFDDAVERAEASVTGADIGKLAVQADGNRKLWRLIGTAPSWEPLVPTGKNVIFVDPAGEGDFTTLSEAMASCAAAAVDNQYVILVTGTVTENQTIVASNFVHVQGLAGARVLVNVEDGVVAVYMHNLTCAVWKDLDVIANNKAMLDAIKVETCEQGVMLFNVFGDTSGTGKGINIVSGSPRIKTSKGAIEADPIVEETFWGVGRSHEAIAFPMLLGTDTSNNDEADLRLAIVGEVHPPTFSVWSIAYQLIGKSTIGNAAYGQSGHCLFTKGATGDNLVLMAATVALDSMMPCHLKINANLGKGVVFNVTGATGDHINWLAFLTITQILTAPL